MKKTFRKAMLSTMAMLLVGVMSLTGVTYAWFTAGTTAAVNQFDVSVVDSAGGSIMISADGDTFAFGTTATPVPTGTKLGPVSTIGELDANGTIKFFNGAISGATTITTSEVTGQASNYETFDLYFYNPGSDSISLKLSNATFDDATEKGKSDLACRFAFVAYGSVGFNGFDKSKYTFSLANYNDADTTDTDTTTVKIFEPNAETHLLTGWIEQQVNVEGALETGVYPYFGVMAASTTPINRYGAVENYTKQIKTTAIGADETIITIDKQSVAKLTVYVWLEGQDVDCISEIAANNFKGAFTFAKYTPAAS